MMVTKKKVSWGSYSRHFFHHLERQRRIPNPFSNSMNRTEDESLRYHDSGSSRGTYVPENCYRESASSFRPRYPKEEHKRAHAEHYRRSPHSHRRRVETEFQEREFRRRHFHHDRYLAYPRGEPEIEIHRKYSQRPSPPQDKRVQRNTRIVEMKWDKNVSNHSRCSPESNQKSDHKEEETETKKSTCSNTSVVSMELETDDDDGNQLQVTASSEMTNKKEEPKSTEVKNCSPCEKYYDTEPDSTPKINKDINSTTNSTSSSSEEVVGSETLTSTTPLSVPAKQSDNKQPSDLVRHNLAVKDPRLQKRSRSSEVHPDHKDSEQVENNATIVGNVVDPRKQPKDNILRSVPLELKLPAFWIPNYWLNVDRKILSFKKIPDRLISKISKKTGRIKDKKLVCLKNRAELKKYKLELEKYCCHVSIEKESCGRGSFQELSEVSIESLIDTKKSYLGNDKEDKELDKSLIEALPCGGQHNKVNKVKKSSSVKDKVRKHKTSSSTKDSEQKSVAREDEDNQLHNVKEIKQDVERLNVKTKKHKISSVSSKSGTERHANKGLKRKIVDSSSDSTAKKKNIHKNRSSSVEKINSITPKRQKLMEDKAKLCKKVVKPSTTIDRTSITNDKKVDDKNTSHNTITYVVHSTVCHSSSTQSTIDCTSIVPKKNYKDKSLPMIVDDESDYNSTNQNSLPPVIERIPTPFLDENNYNTEKEYSLHIPEGSIDSSDSLIRALDETIKDINISISSVSKIKQKDNGSDEKTSSLIAKDGCSRSGDVESSGEINESMISSHETQRNVAARKEDGQQRDCPINRSSEAITSPNSQNNEAKFHQKGNATEKQTRDDCSVESVGIHTESKTSSPVNRDNVTKLHQKGHKQKSGDCSAESSGIPSDPLISKNQNNVAKLCQKGNETNEQASASYSLESVGVSHETLNSSPETQSDVTNMYHDNGKKINDSPVAHDANCGFGDKIIESPESQKKIENGALNEGKNNIDYDIISKKLSELLGTDEDELLLHVRIIENPEIKKESDEVNSNFNFGIFHGHIDIKTEQNDEASADVQSSEKTENVTNELVVNTNATSTPTPEETSAIPPIDRQTAEETTNTAELFENIEKSPSINNSSMEQPDNSSIGSQGPVDSNVSELSKNMKESHSIDNSSLKLPSIPKVSIGSQGNGCPNRPETPKELNPTANQMNAIRVVSPSNEPGTTVVTNQSNVSTMNPIVSSASSIGTNIKSSDSNNQTGLKQSVPPVISQIERLSTSTHAFRSDNQVMYSSSGFSTMPIRRLLPQMLNLSNASSIGLKTQREMNQNFFINAYNLMRQYILVEKRFRDAEESLKLLDKHYDVEFDICNLNQSILRTKLIFGDMLLCGLRVLTLPLQKVDVFVMYLMEYLKKLYTDVENKPTMIKYLWDLVGVHSGEYEKSELLRNFKKHIEMDYFIQQNLGERMSIMQYGILKSQVCHYIRLMQNYSQTILKPMYSRSTETAMKNTPPPNVCISNGSNTIRPIVNMRNNQSSVMTNEMNYHERQNLTEQNSINTVGNPRVYRQNSGSNNNTMNKRLSSVEPNLTNVHPKLLKSTSGGNLMVHANLQQSISHYTVENAQASNGNMTGTHPSLQQHLLYVRNVMALQSKLQAQNAMGIYPHSVGPNAQIGGFNITNPISQPNANYGGQECCNPSSTVVQKRTNSQDTSRGEPDEKRRKPSVTNTINNNASVIENKKRTVTQNARFISVETVSPLSEIARMSNNIQNQPSALQINVSGGYESSPTLHSGFVPIISSGRVCNPVNSYPPTVVCNQDVSSPKSRPPPAYNAEIPHSRLPVYTPNNRYSAPSVYKPDKRHSSPPVYNPDTQPTPPATNADIRPPTPPASENITPYPTPPMSTPVISNEESSSSISEVPSVNAEQQQSRSSTPSVPEEEIETKPFVAMIFPSDFSSASDEIIDLTWLEDDDFIKKEASEKCESNQPHDEEAFLMLDNRKCLCEKVAEYLCTCNTVMYCSQECQFKDWVNHQKVCSSVIMMASGV